MGIVISGGVVSASGSGTFIEVFYNVRDIEMDGKALHMEQKPFIYEGKTYVYLGDVAKAFGRVLEWDENTGGITIVQPGYEHSEIDKSFKIEQYESVVSKIASELESGWPDDMNTFLKEVRDSYDVKMDHIYFADENGNMYCSPSVQLPEGYDPREREWYKAAVENGMYVSKPYDDVINGGEIVSVSKTVRSNGKVVGVIGVDFKH